jgi:hypothetical protein
MATTVSFIFKENTDFIGYKPPAPPLLFEVPHDVFYPFVQSSANANPARGGLTLTFTAVLLSCLAALVISCLV